MTDYSPLTYSNWPQTIVYIGHMLPENIEVRLTPYGDLEFARTDNRFKRIALPRTHFDVNRRVQSESIAHIIRKVCVMLSSTTPLPPLPRRAPALVRIRMAESARKGGRRDQP